MHTEWLSTLVCSHICGALDWDIMKHLQGLLAKATNYLPHSRVLESKAQLSIWTLALRACDVLLGLPVWELEVTALPVVQTPEAEVGAAPVGSKLVSQGKGELVASLGKVHVGLCGVRPLSAQGGCQLFEGGVRLLVKKPLKAGVSPDLLPQMAIHFLEKGHQLLDHQLLRFTCSVWQRSPFWLVDTGVGRSSWGSSWAPFCRRGLLELRYLRIKAAGPMAPNTQGQIAGPFGRPGVRAGRTCSPCSLGLLGAMFFMRKGFSEAGLFLVGFLPAGGSQVFYSYIWLLDLKLLLSLLLLLIME